MLSEIYIENFALIDKLSIELSHGLNVITGETGAGKSIIIDAVGILLGGRSNTDFIRTGTEKCFVQGVFFLTDRPDLKEAMEHLGIDSDIEPIVLSREITANGKNACRINSRVIPLSSYREFARKLINIHGQHEHITLLDEHNQLLMLDRYAGPEVLKLRDELKGLYREMSAVEKEIRQGTEITRELARKTDTLRYQIKEIADAALVSGEEEELNCEKIILQNAEKLMFGCQAACEKIFGQRNGGAADLLREAISYLKHLANLDHQLAQLTDRLNEIFFELDDVTKELTAYAYNVSNNPYRLEEVEKRLFLIRNLKKKYGTTIDDMIKFKDAAMEELITLEKHQENNAGLESRLNSLNKQYHILAGEVTELRKKAGAALASAVTDELRFLHMAGAIFEIAVTAHSPRETGMDHTAFLISPNPGEELKPVAKIVSGGEMSRVMLGIKAILAQLDQTPTLIFDEIDSGLGGTAINAVAKKLAFVSAHTQVLVVTHSPVVASYADRHLYIGKHLISDRTVVRVLHLDEQQRIGELARMLTGDRVSEVTLAQARELLKEAKKIS